LIDVAFSRWRVECCFLDQKQEIGLDAWEERRYIGLKRHLILSSVSYLFLAPVRSRRREKNPELTICQVHNAVAALVQSRWLGRRASSALLDHVAEGITYKQRRNALA
jgi:SRSO17 transposase